ncbi:hypothetical protein FNH22_30210 [Fulvivirga sp. M361]|uniref:hypothetical protein n=1 Tax=Fulvivirga sp. M361 TaxID=2594266 RepID=UPI00117B8B4A|nr:hypothetical protein [Fulvivirga sp. M361]TRX47264.1 hypothetical protein FNH22_30210 [Fulvivirga sp. M361]
MKELGNVFSGISATFALIPGMTILITKLGVPPGASQVVFGASIESVCALTLLMLWVNKQKIKRLPSQRITKYAVILGITFVLMFVSYLFLYGYYVEEIPHTADLLFPIWPNGELQEGLQMHGSHMKLVEAWGRDDVYKVIQSSSSLTIQLTVILFLLNYMGIFMSLTMGFGILGIKIASATKKKPQ